MYDTPSRAASRLTAASGSTPHPATSPVPYSTVSAVEGALFKPTPVRSPTIANSDAFQRLIATYGDLLPHRPKSRMEAINLIFAAAADMPEEEGGTVAAMVMEAFRSIKTEQCKSAASQVSRSSGERRESSERENLERKNETEDERSTPVEPIADPYTKLLERYSHLLPLGASGSREKILETLLGAAVELPDGQRETAIQAIMEVYEAASATSAGGGASVHGPSDPYDLLVLQYGHLIPGSNHANRAETFDALLLAATELSDGEGSLVARLVLEAHDVSASGTQGSSTHRSSVDTRRSALSSSLTEDPFQRLMAEYGHLLPHRPDTRMATLDLMFVAASALPEAEGELVTVLISEAWEALNAILPVLDQEAADAIAVAEAADAIQGQGEEAESSGDDGDHECEDDRERSDNAEAQGPCPCCGPCGSVCEYEAAIAPQPLPQPVKPRSFRRSRRQRPPSPEEQPEAGPLRPRRSALRSASLDLWIRDRKKFKSGPSGSEGIDMLYAFLEREAAKAEALGNARDKGNGKGKAREAQRVLFADERRQPEDEEAEQLEERRRARQVSVSSGSWDEAELAARGLTEPELEREHEAQERRRWFRRR
ncbi:hypothetical protein CspeluHIS016_0209480 [Cutaneotrichosporon spelunceum]|uniref:Uncharacterized protein n=1 Tax=Cutaneotrichosporon spelunceum TaxID=1672016 RepID=A0AAD3TS81_9TREE|nr:hypothetical protein CspeluHIS016_0209480 [Cutaneotrichosporon spelunceum]